MVTLVYRMAFHHNSFDLNEPTSGETPAGPIFKDSTIIWEVPRQAMEEIARNSVIWNEHVANGGCTIE